jgi:hypothetical protein
MRKLFNQLSKENQSNLHLRAPEMPFTIGSLIVSLEHKSDVLELTIDESENLFAALEIFGSDRTLGNLKQLFKNN